MGQTRILIVEDDHSVALDIKKHLEKLGYCVPAVTSSGREAVKLVKDIRPNLILMGVMLKEDINRTKTTQEIHTFYDVPVIYLAESGEGNPLESTLTEPYGYLVKSFESRELHSIIEMALYKHEMEMTLKKNKEWLHTILRSIGDGVIATNINGEKVTFMNLVAEKLTGWSQREAIGKNIETIFSILHESNREPVGNPVKEALQKGRIIELKPAVLVSRDGSEFPIDGSSAPIQNIRENISGVVLVFKDNTERRRAEKELRESEDRYQTLIKYAQDGIVMAQEEGIQIVNPAFCKLIGYSEDEILGTDFLQYLHPDEREKLSAFFKRPQFEEKIHKLYETRMLHKDEKIRKYVTISMSTTFLNGKLTTIAVLQDITERKNIEDTLRKTEEQLRHSQKMEAIGRLAGGVAHDFNNILTVINGYSEILLASMESEDVYRKEVEQILKAGIKASSLVNQLLAFSRRQVLQAKVLDLNVVISNLQKMLRRLIGEDIELITYLDSVLGRIKADPGQIEQVIVNLAVNSRDAMPHGGQLIIETSNVLLNDSNKAAFPNLLPGMYVMLKVSDTGNGMDEETLEQIFEPFFTTKDSSQGTGLGLSTVYGIVKQSDGHIEVDSTTEKGSVFKIFFPLIEEPLDEIVKEEIRTDIAEGSETILLVEDDKVVQKLVQDILRKKGYNILTTSNAEEALKIFCQPGNAIDLVIVDVIMPGMSGRQLVEKLLLQSPDMKVLYISGHIDKAISQHGILDEGIEFLQKPFSSGQLAYKIREMLDNNGKKYVVSD